MIFPFINGKRWKMADLKGIEIFDKLSDEELQEIEPYIQEVSFKKKEIIFGEGDSPEWFYILKSGKVKITKYSTDGKEIILEVISPREMFGGVAVIRGFPYPGNAIAMDDTITIRMSRRNLLRLLDRFPNLMHCIALQIGDRMKDSYDTLKNIALERVEARIASLLLKLADKVGKETPAGLMVDMRLTKQDVADMVGTTVETSIRTFSKLKKKGIIEDSEGRVVIKDRASLESLSS
jgi:CRP-like cAMP-binding protein